MDEFINSCKKKLNDYFQIDNISEKQMTSSKSLTESTSAELIERKKKHIFFIKLIDEEIAKRKPKITIKKATNNEAKKDLTATRDDIKAVLSSKNITYKANMTKDELTAIVRKNNLVKAVEEFHKNKTK